MITIDAGTQALLVGTIIPILVAALTKSSASPAVKAILNAGLAAVSGAVAVLVQQGSQHWQAFVYAIGISWVVSVATYYGFLKPTGTAEVVALKTDIGKKTDLPKAA
jgi:hypothetical protein